MSKLPDRKEQTRMTAQLNCSVKSINETSYTVSSQSSGWKLGRCRDIETSSTSKLEVLMKRGLIHKTKIGNITTSFEEVSRKGDDIRCLIF